MLNRVQKPDLKQRLETGNSPVKLQEVSVGNKVSRCQGVQFVPASLTGTNWSRKHADLREVKAEESQHRFWFWRRCWEYFTVEPCGSKPETGQIIKDLRIGIRVAVRRPARMEISDL
ncbi:hypothetical protein PBY51_005623 [Eleginops maclovinus]|uniref:Uncharacterized protein n=1 Tax=Eleginops maclovinus TaxID=56733 RepID=A0AAN7X0R6_ELEMC|nr:hypothetical protein PBY51_005623 [Eleginops maclovinus]